MKINLNDLCKVKGIGFKTIERVKEFINIKDDIRKKRNTSLCVDELEIDTIHHKDNIIGLRELIPDDSIDLTVTSPPYDNLRTYGGYDFDYKLLAKELYRVTKDGGVVVWIVGDQTVNGSETGTSFKQALYFKQIGFNLHDTMIYKKNNALPLTHKRYEPRFEYMFVFTIGQPKTFNPLKIKSKHAGEKEFGTKRSRDGSMKKKTGCGKAIKEHKVKGNVWEYNVGYNRTTKDKFAYQHPAMFPEQLAKDHILSWSNENDVVLDPFLGSGTTAKLAKQLNRKYVGFEVNKEYINITKERLNEDK